MSPEPSFTVCVRVDLRPDLLPVAIFSNDGRPLPATWARILQAQDPTLCGYEAFILELLDDAGQLCEFIQYETLEIALDQAREILGVEPDEWMPTDGAAP